MYITGTKYSNTFYWLSCTSVPPLVPGKKKKQVEENDECVCILDQAIKCGEKCIFLRN